MVQYLWLASTRFKAVRYNVVSFLSFAYIQTIVCLNTNDYSPMPKLKSFFDNLTKSLACNL